MFAPIFALEHVSPAVEEALGKAMLYRAKLEKQIATQEPPQYRLSKDATMPVLRVVAEGCEYSRDVARVLEISIPTAAARLGMLEKHGLVTRTGLDGRPGAGQAYIYAITPKGMEALE